MSEPHEAPGTGGSENAPGTDAPEASGEASAPTSAGSMENLLSERFSTGYGKGAEKGRREGAELALKALGLPTDLDAARRHLEGLGSAREPESPKAPDVRETQEYRQLATEHRTLTQQLEELQSKLGPLERRADEARLEKLRGAARAKGVGEGQLAALVAMHGDRVRLSDQGDLEVLSSMPDGSMVAAGQTVESFLGEVVEANPWLLAPRQPQGGGSGLKGVVASARGGASADMVDRRPLSERLKG